MLPKNLFHFLMVLINWRYGDSIVRGSIWSHHVAICNSMQNMRKKALGSLVFALVFFKLIYIFKKFIHRKQLTRNAKKIFIQLKSCYYGCPHTDREDSLLFAEPSDLGTEHTLQLLWIVKSSWRTFTFYVRLCSFKTYIIERKCDIYIWWNFSDMEGKVI